MFNRKSARQFASAALIALGAAAAGSTHAGNVQWSVSVNLPPIGVPVYHVPAPVYHPPVPVHAPVVVYRPVPPPMVVYRPVPVVDHRDWGHRHYHHRHHHHRHHHGHHRDDRRGGHDDRGDRDGRWEPGPRHRHH